MGREGCVDQVAATTSERILDAIDQRIRQQS